MEDLSIKLNRLAKESGVFSNIKRIPIKEISNSQENGIVFIENDGPVKLPTPKNFFMTYKELKPINPIDKTQTGLILIIRCGISYNLAKDINTIGELVRDVYPLVNSMLCQVEEQTGLVNNSDYRIQLEDYDGNYFRYLTDANGLELRLSVYKE